MKWEYKTIKISAMRRFFLSGKFDEIQLDRMMNDLGEQGWELTAAFDTNMDGATRDVVAVFKRQRQ